MIECAPRFDARGTSLALIVSGAPGIQQF